MINDFTPQGGKLRPRATEASPEKQTTDSHTSIGQLADSYQNQATSDPNSTDNTLDKLPSLDTSETMPSPAVKPSKKRRFRLTKKQWIIVGCIGGVLVVTGTLWWNWKLRHSVKGGTVTVHQTKKAPPKPTTVASTLSGLQVDPAINDRPVTAVMIENSPDARPQSGLDQAGVVFEAIAEGGITRFLALYQDTAPDYLGPVRSVRPYYLQWLHGFDAAVAHVGGSPQALADIKAWGVKDLDQFANSGSYTRISSRYAPHNVYTSIANLNGIEAKKGYGASRFTGFPRKPDTPSKQPDARTIDLAISSGLYNSHFDYDPANNRYIRSQGGAPHMQLNRDGTQVQITPRVVIALTMQKGVEPDDLHTAYTTIGSGAMYVFQDGIMQQGTWSKTAGASQFTFADAQNKPLKLNAGQTWITVLDSPAKVSAKP